MRVVQQPQRFCLQVNDVLLAPQERMTMQTTVNGATLLQQQAEWHLVDTAAPCHEDSRLHQNAQLVISDLCRLYCCRKDNATPSVPPAL